MKDQLCKKCQAENSIITDYICGETCSECGLVYDESQSIKTENECGTYLTENECGTYLLIRENGKTRIVKEYPKLDKIHRNFLKIQKLLSSVNISKNIIEEVKTLYDKVGKNMNMQGRNINHIIIGIYYYVLRKQKQAKTLKEVTEMFKCILPNLTERIIKKAFNSIKTEIVETNDENEFNDIEKNYIQNFIGGNLEKYNNKMIAYKIIENINKSGLLEGKNPKTIAGIALLLSYKLLNDNFDNINEFYNMFSNKTTLNKSYDLIKDSLNKIIPQEYKNINILLNDICP